MAPDEEDLYDEEFDFVDEEDETDDQEEQADQQFDEDKADDEQGDEPAVAEDEEGFDEYGRPEPAANYVVHVYEHKKFKRTIDRPFTAEDAEAFATEYNRTAKSYGRRAVAGKNDAKPKKSIS